MVCIGRWETLDAGVLAVVTPSGNDPFINSVRVILSWFVNCVSYRGSSEPWSVGDVGSLVVSGKELVRFRSSSWASWRA